MKIAAALSFIFISVVLFACGGGGDGGDDSCQKYCEFTCSKAANCEFFPEDEIDGCISSCIQTTQDLGRSNDSCEQAQAAIEPTDCQDLAAILGFTRTKSNEKDKGVEIGQTAAQFE